MYKHKVETLQEEIDKLRYYARKDTKLNIDEKSLPRWQPVYIIREAKKIAYTAVERLYPKGHRNNHQRSWVEKRMYREFIKYLLIEVKEGEVYDTPMWIRPILNTIPEFGQDGRRKEFFGLIHRCTHCQFFFGTYKRLFDHKKQCQ